MYFRSLPPSDLTRRTRWYISMRWLYLGAIIIPTILTMYIGMGWGPRVQHDTFLGLVALVSNGIFYLISRKPQSTSFSRNLAIAIIVTDIVLFSYLIYSRGGIESRSLILYTIPIIMSAAILGRRAIYFSALASIIAYDSIIIGGYFNLFHPFNTIASPMRYQFPYVFNSIAFFSSILIVIGLCVDFMTRLLIDKERQATENLASLNRAQAIAKLGSWKWDFQTNEVTWSKTMYDIFNVTDASTTITPESFFDKIYPADKKAVRAEVRKAIKKKVSLSLDYRITTTDDTVKYIRGDGEIITDSSGHSAMLGTARDITEERILDQAKDEFVALASHQLRTPTTVVKQYLSMLLDGYAGDLSEAQRKYLTTAYDSNERQITTINDLLNVAQIDSGKMKLHMETFDVIELLNTVVLEESVRVADKHQTISLKTRHRRLYCRADRHRMRMVLENIIENAHKYSPEHKRIEVQLTRSNHHIYIAIKDHGIGIDKNNMPKMFQKFTRIDNPAVLAEEGTGLGLYWVDKVIRLHGGKITVTSKLRRGTTFTIALPQAKTSRKRA